MASKTIWCTAIAAGEEPTPLFLGREDGTIEKYISVKDTDLGQPSLVLRGHTKAVTALYATSADEVYSCSLDGTFRRWNASVEGSSERTARTVQLTHFRTGLRCLAHHNNRFYAGGEDGSLNVVDGEKQSTWDGHTDVLSCIAAPEGELLVTGGYDHHVRVWNTTTGRCICILQGHQNQVKGLAVVDSGENAEGEPTSVILSFSRDGVMKAWRMPNPQDPSEDPLLVLTEGEAAEDEPRRSAAVSFQEPKVEEEEGKEVPEGQGAPPPVLMEAPDLASDVGAKSALKPKEKQFVRRQAALGTVELPQAPHVVCYHPEEEEGAHLLLLVGATEGYVLGIDAAAFAKAITSFVATNEAKVSREVKSTQATLRKSVALIKKKCRKAVQGEKKRLVRLAKRALKEKKTAEKEARRRALEEKRAAAAAARAEAAEEEEGDEEQPEEEEEEEEAPEEEQSEDEEGEEREGEDESDQLALLTDDQRAQLTAFTAAEEASRDEKIATLEKAVEQHLAQIRPLALSTYDRRREDFYRLKGTTYTKLGHDAVLTVVKVGEKIYGSQGSHIVPSKIAMGVTSL